MWLKILEKIVLDITGKFVTFVWEKIFQNKSKTSETNWDDNIGDYVAGVKQKDPILKSDIDVDKWYKQDK